MEIGEELKKFITQANLGKSHKTSEYPKFFDNFKFKVSFGQGRAARIPWIAILGEGIYVQDGYYPAYLYYKEQDKLILSYTISETYQSKETWSETILGESKKISEVIMDAKKYGDSFIYKTYNISNGDILEDGTKRKLSNRELELDLNKIVDIYRASLKKEEVQKEISSFKLEKQLEDFIIENWETIKELNEKYELIFDDAGDLKSRQFKANNIGFIDILVKDKKDGSHVVIELKREKASDNTVGQIMRYMGWVKKKYNDEKVKGIIISGDEDEKLNYALSVQDNIQSLTYKMNFELNSSNS